MGGRRILEGHPEDKRTVIMAIYEYTCPLCGTFEVFQKMSEPPITECPECARKGIKSAVQKQISAPAFHLKGGGWYKTDYGSSPGASSSNGSSSNGSGSKVKSSVAEPASTKTGGESSD